MPYHLSLLAAAEISVGRDDEADAAEREMTTMLENGSEQWSTAESYRIVAHARYRRDRNVNAAIARLERAVGIANTQGAALWELRAAVDLAEVHRDNASIDNARAVLEAVIQSFPVDGHEMTDYRRATEFIAQLH